MLTSEPEFWQQHHEVQFVGPYDVKNGTFYFTDREIANSSKLQSIVDRNIKTVELTLNDWDESMIIKNLTRRALYQHLLSRGFSRFSKLIYINNDPNYVIDKVMSHTTFTVIRGFCPDITAINETGNIDIRFPHCGRFLIFISKEQWGNWIGEEVKVKAASALDSKAYYALKGVNLDNNMASLMLGGEEFQIDLDQVYVPGRSSTLKRHDMFIDMHRFRNFLSGKQLNLMYDSFFNSIEKDGKLVLAYDKSRKQTAEFKPVLKEGELDQW